MQSTQTWPSDSTTASQRIAVGSTGAINARYFVRHHAFLCRVRRHWIILDLHSDQYFCIPARAFAALGPQLHGWSSDAGRASLDLQGHDGGTATLARQLVDKGVLSESSESAGPLLQCTIAIPTSALDSAVPVSRTYRALVTPAFLFACMTADRQLHRCTVEATVKVVQARRLRNTQQVISVDQTKARTLVAAFNSLRLWYPRAYLCLFDSLALLEFLALHGIYPQWIFGVTADPFQAHCWLQEGPVVLNDTLFRVCNYTPIMGV